MKFNDVMPKMRVDPESYVSTLLMWQPRSRKALVGRYLKVGELVVLTVGLA
jgi:hypothetical protein